MASFVKTLVPPAPDGTALFFGWFMGVYSTKYGNDRF